MHLVDGRMGRYEGPSTGRLGAGPQRPEGGISPRRQWGEMTPPQKLGTPLRSPLGFSSWGALLTCIEPCIFRPRFEIALRGTTPSVMRNGPP